jgi:hypothetical protein
MQKIYRFIETEYPQFNCYSSHLKDWFATDDSKMGSTRLYSHPYYSDYPFYYDNILSVYTKTRFSDI